MRHLAPALLLLTGCLIPEEGIDDTRIVGALSIPPVHLDEKKEAENDRPLQPVQMDPLHFGYREWSGSLVTEADLDHWLLVTPVARGADNPIAIDITLGATGQSASIAVLNLDVLTPLGDPTVVSTEDFSYWTLHTFEAEAGVNYVVRISGASEAGVDYSCFALGQHPDEAKILVGAYSGAAADERGSLLAGTNAKPFVEGPNRTFESWYEMLFVREFLTDGNGDIEKLDERVASAWIWAGTWSNLSQGLPAGTWHNKTPIAVNLKKKGKPELHGTPPGGSSGGGDTGGEARGDTLIADVPRYPTVEVPEPAVIDRIAPVAIGQTWPETEPNDTDINDAFTDPSGAQDLGTLTGVGYVDVITGGTLVSDGTDYWGSDVDTFKFRVPEPTFLSFKLAWADPAMDLDILLVDADGRLLDQGYYGFPEIPEIGTEILQPGRDYYLGVMLWIGPGVAGQEVPYDLTLEQLAE